VITEAVEELLAATGLPGMAVLQFAFGGDASNAYLPHNHKPNSVVYSGTHDNDTSLGWFADLDAETRDHVCHYLNVSGESIGWDLIRACIASEAKLAIIPLQDLLSLGSDARLNTPGAATGNWQWRTTDAQLDMQQAESAAYLMEQNRLHGRI
jgi:4-alpha-glucanotransferase